MPAQALACKFSGQGIAGPKLQKTARGVGVQLMSVLGDSIDTIRQQCAKFDKKNDLLAYKFAGLGT